MVICVGPAQFKKAFGMLRDCGIVNTDPCNQWCSYSAGLSNSTRRDVRRAAVEVLKDRKAKK